MDRAYKISHLRNSGDAYRRFHGSSLAGGANEIVFTLMRHKLMGGVIALMGAAGLVGCLITFWPK